MPRVLVTDRFTPESLARLQAELKCDTRFSASHHPTAEELKDAEILMIRSRTRVNDALLDAAPHLKLVVSATAGFDHIDCQAAARAKVQVCHTPRANTESAAQLTLLLMLAAKRRFVASANIIHQRKWKDALPLAHELGGESLGLLGFGRVGQRVAQLVAPFGLKVFAYDPYQPDEAFQNLGVERVGITELLVQSDLLSLHVPLTKETYHIMRMSTLEALPDHAWVINTSRGPVISESELVAALEQGVIAGAALDVFESEPLTRDSKLRDLPNVIMTPHVGAYTKRLHKASAEAVEKVAEFLRSGTVSDSLPPRTEWAKFL